jgi:hypothetical protein
MYRGGNFELRDQGPLIMPEPAQNTIVRNLVEALERLHNDLDRVELWTAALGCFQHPVPEYRPDDCYLLPPPSKREGMRR